MKYTVKLGWSWKSFACNAGDVIDAADLKTADGTPLPKAVIDLQLARKVMEPVAEPAQQPPLEA